MTAVIGRAYFQRDSYTETYTAVRHRRRIVSHEQRPPGAGRH
jgi:hypothetical protein